MIDNTKCLIWGENYEASRLHDSRDHSRMIFMESARAGGAYKMWANARLSVKDQRVTWKARLTTWLVNQREQGVEAPRITDDIVDLIDRQRPLPVHERADRLLRFIAGQIDKVGNRTKVYDDTPKGHTAYAWSESTEWREVLYLRNYLFAKGWLEGSEEEAQRSYFEGGVTVEGYSQIEARAKNTDSSRAFVAMWFDERMDEIYENGIAPAICEAGYEPMLIKNKEHINRIDDEIIAEIKRSRFVVADFTHGRGGARGSVYYEAGFAHGLGIKVFLTCKKRVKLAFDIQQYNCIFWKGYDDLRECLKNRIEAVIGEGPEKSTR